MSTTPAMGRIRLTPAASKARSNRSHARRRALERFGVWLAESDVAAIEAMIRDRVATPECVPVRRDAHRHRSLHAVRVAGAWLPVLYDEATASMLSVLPARALAHYRPDLDRGLVPDPGPATGPDGPAPIDDGRPPVGTILGRMDLRPTDCGPGRFGIAGPLPPFAMPPPLGDAPTLAEVEGHIRAIGDRRCAVQGRLAATRDVGQHHPDRRRIVEERGRLVVEFRAIEVAATGLKRLRADILRRDRVSASGAEDPDDPIALLRSLFAAARSMGGRLEWAITDQERAAQNAAQRYLELHTRCIPPTEGDES